jgi:hypothetical protein
MLHKKDQSRVKEVWYRVEEDKPIDRADIEKGFEISKGEYVVVADEELKKIAPATQQPWTSFSSWAMTKALLRGHHCGPSIQGPDCQRPSHRQRAYCHQRENDDSGKSMFGAQ